MVSAENCLIEPHFDVAGTVYPAPAKSIAGYELPTLPGHGNRGESCGQKVEYRKCGSCGHQFWVESSCMMRECPDCYEKWAFREAKEAMGRLWMGSRRVMHDRMIMKRECRLLHVVVSLPSEGLDLVASRRKAYDVASSRGVLGGCSVPHPFRDACGEEEYRLDGFIHHHMLVLVHDKLLERSDPGVVFKTIRGPESSEDAPHYPGFRSPREVKRCIQYLLTHCGIWKGRHALTWFGALSYRNLPTGLLERSFPEAYDELNAWEKGVRCPECGSLDTWAILGDGTVDPGGPARALGIKRWGKGAFGWLG